MTEPLKPGAMEVQLLLEAIYAKLEANRGIVSRSLAFGRLTWRKRSGGEFEVDLEPKI